MFVFSFREALPAHLTEQSALTEELATLLPEQGKLVRRYACNSSHIFQRYHEISSLNDQVVRSGAALSEKMRFYKDVTSTRIQSIYRDTQSPPGHITHVSCTGYVSPSAVQELIVERSWQRETTSFHAYHMGCYAAFPALRMTIGEILRREQQGQIIVADVVHNEICSLHLASEVMWKPEQIIVQTLFGDGHVKYSIQATRPEQRSLRVLSIAEEQIRETSSHMTWWLTETGFRMSLAREVPQVIRQSVGGFVDRLLSEARVALKLSDLVFAIHPGGPRIISEVADVLSLRNEQVRWSHEVLRDRGNISSATLPMVWSRVLADKTVEGGQHLLSLAFGPGLTICGALMEILN